MRIDLHCHSTHSDGSLPASEVAERAFARGVELFCLTDHDTSEGYASTLAAFPNALRGVELSCVEDQRTVHLLIYQKPSSTSWERIESALSKQREVRRERVFVIAERLEPLGAGFDPVALLARTGGTVGRPHIAEELVHLGHVRSRSEAFDRFLKDGGPGDVQIDRLSLEEGLGLGLLAGGCMSLAHPHMHGERAEPMLRKYKDSGLTGLEVYYGPYKSKTRKQWGELASKYGLVQTGGSDFHGDTMPKVATLGVDMPDLHIAALLRWLEVSDTHLSSCK